MSSSTSWPGSTTATVAAADDEIRLRLGRPARRRQSEQPFVGASLGGAVTEAVRLVGAVVVRPARADQPEVTGQLGGMGAVRGVVVRMIDLDAHQPGLGHCGDDVVADGRPA